MKNKKLMATLALIGVIVIIAGDSGSEPGQVDED